MRTKSMHGRRAVSIIVMATALVASSFVAAPAANAATCTPRALTPFTSNNWEAKQRGEVLCDAHISYSFTLRLSGYYGGAWHVLDEVSSTQAGSVYMERSTWVTCGPSYMVRTFLYINVGGVGKSDTSGTASCHY